MDDLINCAENFKGGKVFRSLECWEYLSSDQGLLDIVRGVMINFESVPDQSGIPWPLRFSVADQSALDATMIQYILKEIVEVCGPVAGNAFYSNIFPVLKPNGTARLILNLSDFNLHIKYEHFKMDTLKDVIPVISSNCYFASLDLKDAYFSVYVQPQDRDWFRFLWNGGHYRFTCMPQGFASAPRVFTKLLKPVIAHFRALGMIASCYIDDCIFMANSAEELIRNVGYAMWVFDCLGLTINVAKSSLVPSQEMEFLGFLLNSVNMTVMLTPSKKEKIRGLGCDIVRKGTVVIRKLASFIGNVVAAEHGVPFAPLRYKYLEVLRNCALKDSKGDFDGMVTLDERALVQVQWWIENVNVQVKEIVVPPFELEMYTDASGVGWGASVGDRSTSGHWTLDEKEVHINRLELTAVLLGLQSLCKELHGVHIRIRSDNVSTVACINHCGSVRLSLLDVAERLFEWAIARKITLSASHIKGSANVEADRLSRDDNVDTEWRLKPPLFRALCHTFGMPTVDLFASRLNNQLERYISWRPDPGAFAVDAFTVGWSQMFSYAFPPFSMIGRALMKISQDAATVLMVVPVWPTRVWFSRALQLLVEPPRILPMNSLDLPQAPHVRHPLGRKLVMAAMLLSGDPLRIGEYRRRLQNSSLARGDWGRARSIGRISRDGGSFLSEGKLIQFAPL